MLLVLRPIHMFVLKGPTKYGFCPLFARPLCSFFKWARSFAPMVFLGTIFLKNSWALRSWCAHNIFICCHKPVSRTRISFLAVRSLLLSLFCALTELLIDSHFSLVNARWSFAVLRCSLTAYLNSLVAAEFSVLAGLFFTHYTLLMVLQAARLLLPVVRRKLSWTSTFFVLGRAPAPGYLEPNPFSVHPSP